ncbi:divalent cation tolerance protein [Chlamydia pneumoniae TW-183]|uniref:Divalent-cation tolerance protein CutA n=2 Tax=Chlamydia pneumoniae TaxID=83558 RepID=Q9Z6Z9_CHLPN|nr:divalent-cation tolerance protein CutA [Chlamydia pneumoniae]AAD19045.1 Periplasmic Divalent Cation Tolerance Protein [Chlamydia pneumoniae CWL029]AAF38739.1 periplasmic divalent cation tolerance protein CutA1 [Chlamydia pneumoniae AR39]AAP98868.1 divalent cation tolerance protein [Chlamydia pneumoniae TW-183]CRI33438.1 Divalent-cation tolerance protein CutA [Chlamydia pneumoniae]CRI36301.1 Divalent-cation tolerance protein CutA [Chlamydia pneumoniae]
MTAVLILTSFPSEESARSLARHLITERLASCVHVFPKGTSTYLWEGKLCESEEHHIQIKSIDIRFSEICLAIQEFSGYEVPEVLLFPIENGDPRYLNWLTILSYPEKPPLSD